MNSRAKRNRCAIGSISFGVENLAQDAGGKHDRASRARVDGGFGMPGPANTPPSRVQREHMAGPREILGLLFGSITAATVAARSCAVMPVLLVQWSIGTVNAVPCGAVFVSTIIGD